MLYALILDSIMSTHEQFKNVPNLGMDKEIFINPMFVEKNIQTTKFKTSEYSKFVLIDLKKS